ncbi:DinB family protein [Bacillus sp. 1NLA3E]|uniref:DinB family protein n=1 Tax=Bacillus sp. 1NLA3E TaxID=666686 RepID=UPI001F48112E|nr:DinB family protein [Bacillus sp. 1NLA3E]
MYSLRTILNMYNHLEWANQRILELLQSIEFENEKAIRLFSHILLAEQVWFTRLKGEDSSQISIWSDIDVAACAKIAKQNEESYSLLLKELTNSDLDLIISYKNSKGKEFVTSVGDILTHIALHGQYHRGQINQLVRRNGIEPVNIDYITLVR